jgi:uncharacterized membrane protein
VDQSRKSEQLLKTELIISYVLRVGVIVCALVLALGLLLTWFDRGAMRDFSGATLPTLLSGQTISAAGVPRSALEFQTELAVFHPNAVIALGLLLLIGLPIIRVLLTVFLFLFERDYTYFVITLFVFAILLSGIVLGRAL